MTRDTETPGEEFRVAVAGPAVTAAVIALCIAISAALSRMGDFLDSAQLSDQATTPALALLGWLAIINAALLVFNLVPALPLDGGRVARAIAWRVTGDRNRGTRFSGRAGQAFSYALIGVGVFFLLKADAVSGVWCIVLGLFLGQAARGFVAASRFSERLEGITVGDVMDDDPVAIPAETTVLDAHEDYFLRYRFSWFPTVDTAGRLVGVLREERVDGALAAGQPALPVHEVLDGEGDTIARVGRDASLEALLGSDALRRLGALPVVDAHGILCGVVRIDDVRRALTAAVAGPLG
jgi:CBS domain-containing protein